MARTVIAAQTPKGPYSGATSAGDLDITMTAGDAVNGDEVVWVGNRMLILMRNSDGATPYTATITSVADAHGRLDTITAYSLAAGDVAVKIVERGGWQQSNNTVYLDCDNAAVLFAVLAI